MLNTKWRCVLHLLAVCALTSPALAADKVLSVVATATGASTATAYPGHTVEVDIRVDDAAMVAGAAFTVTFDPANLALAKVSSTYFGAFANLGLPPSAVSFSPLITNPVTTGAMLAAARPDNGSGTQVALFTLSFLVKGPFDNYPVSIPISISRSRISNTDAGFDAAGEDIPSLVGVGAGTYPAHTVQVVSFVLTIAIPDGDDDGIPDDWEVLHFSDKTTANGKSDYDRDGYTDLQEYLNWANNETDPAGGVFDPELTNAPGGIGYVPYDDDFWTIMIPVILNSGRQQ